MSYAVMGSENSQEMIGSGKVSSSAATTGAGDTAGPYAGSSSYSKMFIENGWGSLSEFVGDAYIDSGLALHAANKKGGAALSGQPAAGAVLPNTASNHWIDGVNTTASVWGTPTSVTGTDNHSDKAYPGDMLYTTGSTNHAILVGGSYADGNGAGLAYMDTSRATTYSAATAGARIVYVMTLDTVGAFYKVSFVQDAGLEERTDSTIIDIGDTCVLPVAQPYEGYTFMGWYMDSGYLEFAGMPGSYIAPSRSLTIYARYSEDPLLTVSLTKTLDGNTHSLAGIVTISSPASIRSDSLGFLKALPSAGYSVSVSSAQAYIRYVGNGLYVVDPNIASGTISLTIAAVTESVGIADLKVTRLADGNTSAVVQMTSVYEAGLPAGEIHFGGVYCRVQDGVTIYGAITDTALKIDSTPLTSDGIAVAAGTEGLSKKVTLKDAGRYIHHIYAYYTNGDGTVTYCTADDLWGGPL